MTGCLEFRSNASTLTRSLAFSSFLSCLSRSIQSIEQHTSVYTHRKTRIQVYFFRSNTKTVRSTVDDQCGRLHNIICSRLTDLLGDGNMPEVHFEIIRLEDIGKDVFKAATSSKHSTPSRPTQKLSNGDVENLKHYLNRYNQAPGKVAAEKRPVHDAFPSSSHTNKPSSSSSQPSPNYVDITDDFYSSKRYTEPNEPSDHSQPLIDIYRYHHHYRRHHQHTKQGHARSITAAKSIDPAAHFALEYATCGMKKNTRLPVPHENFSLANGCFGDDAGFTMGHHQKNFLGAFTLVRSI